MKININGKAVKKGMMYVLSGRVLTGDIIFKNTRFILTLLVIIVLQISNRYSCNTKLSTINKLEKALKDVRYESLTVSAKLISVSRATKVKELAAKHNLGLRESKEPIYKIEK